MNKWLWGGWQACTIYTDKDRGEILEWASATLTEGLLRLDKDNCKIVIKKNEE